MMNGMPGMDVWIGQATHSLKQRSQGAFCHPPTYPVACSGMDLAGCRLSFRSSHLEQGLFHVGSSDGELVSADFIRPEGQDNPEHVRSIAQVRVGMSVGGRVGGCGGGRGGRSAFIS
jgi:hypothetical protein